MIKLAETNKEIEVLAHPNYNDSNRIHKIINSDYYRKLNEYLCCFNDGLCWKYVNIKVFEITSVGSLLLIEDSIKEQLNELGFYDNINCIMCNESNIIEKINWILDHNNFNKINEIRLAGMKLTREKHNTELRATDFNNYINKLNIFN
jgi:hypothetical protein